MADYKSQCEFFKLFIIASEKFAETKESYVSSEGVVVDKKFLAKCEKIICSYFKNSSKKSKNIPVSGNKKNVGFTKLFYFAESVVDYHGTILKEHYPDVILPSFEKFMPDGITPNPLYRILSHPLMTRVFSLTARISGQKKKYYYSATPEFIASHNEQIQEARVKDQAKGYKDYTQEEFDEIFKTTKNFSGYLFNTSCYTHAHQSKIIETSKDKSIDLVDDIPKDDEVENQKKLDDVAHRIQAGGYRLSDIKSKVLELYDCDMSSIMEQQETHLVQFKDTLEP